MTDQRYVLALLLCLTAGSNSQLLGPTCASNQQLVNAVVYEGDSSSFSNQLDPNGVRWEIAPFFDPSGFTSNPPYTIADDNSVRPPFDGPYAVTPTQLYIASASVYSHSSNPYSTSGTYILTYKTDGCQSMAHLIVVSNGPLCLCTASDADNAVLSCELDYGVTQISAMYPTMTWNDESGNEVYNEMPFHSQDHDHYDASTSYYQIKSSDAASYTCRVTFTSTDNWLPNMATNAPSFTASCTVANCVKPTATN